MLPAFGSGFSCGAAAAAAAGSRGLRLRVLRGDVLGGACRKGGDGEQPQEPGMGRHDQLLVLRLNCSSSSFGLALAFFSSHSSVGLSPVCIVM